VKTLRLLRGDLVLTGNEYQEVSGEFKIQQDLRNALLEPLGNDRFHPGWGSSLPQFIGNNYVTAETVSRVSQEINRVLSNYVAVQQDTLQRDSLAGRKSRFTTADVVRSVEGVSMSAVADRVFGTIRLSTYGAYNVAFNLPIGKAS
jgi:phage baseplate assembly protein W